ncbi:hypothetical protein, partial [Paraprevotella clara]|uniref:hypothetical protein n=1 Tax=Paraprevotella clara TaxID=454154 RepID=UPI003FF1040C
LSLLSEPFGFLVGIDFTCGSDSGKGRIRQGNSERIERNTQIYDLRKAAVNIREPLAQRYLTTGRPLYLCMRKSHRRGVPTAR